MTRRYVFIGAGAVGSAVGGLIAQQGAEVVLVARGDHARVTSQRGVRLRHPDGDSRLPVAVVTDPEQVRLTVDDVLVLTVKTHQTQAAVDQWADRPVHDTTGSVAGRAADLLPLLTASNGVASEDIALRRFARVFAVCIWCPVVMIDPGEVFVRAAPLHGIFHVGRYGGAVQDDALPYGLIADWRTAGLRIVHTPRIMAWKYAKLIANLGNVLEALLGEVVVAQDLLDAVRSEGQEVLGVAGVDLPSAEERRAAWDDLEIRTVPGQPTKLGGSSWQSLVRGSATIETDYLNGEIVLMARRFGLSAPLNSRLTALARVAAREGHRPGDLDLPQLRELLTS
ncbi:ketopantoate reductase family protein [Streptomyces sp. NPDC088788]|uniref:ketopantoate reductase family protein n=1 Tax=Streptomyces sp. NPDC088788 TaxID=3365898 RepID=UPI003828CD88